MLLTNFHIVKNFQPLFKKKKKLIENNHEKLSGTLIFL